MASDEWGEARTLKGERRKSAQEAVHPLCDGKRSEMHDWKGVGGVPVCRKWMDRCGVESGFFLTQSSRRAQTERQDKLGAAGGGRGFASETQEMVADGITSCQSIC